jgi:hypothetical protein
VQGAVTKYARSTATAASLAVYPDGRDTRCRSCRNPTGIYVRVCLPAGLPMASLRHRSSFTLRRKTADPRSRQHKVRRTADHSGLLLVCGYSPPEVAARNIFLIAQTQADVPALVRTYISRSR